MKTLPIAEFCKTSSGGTPSRNNPEYYENGSIPWIKSGELKKRIVDSSEEFITSEGLNNSSAKIIPKGAILLAMYGATVGEVAELGMDASTNQAICNIRPNADICNKDYLFHFLQAIKPKLISQSVGGGQPNISQAIIRAIEVPLPELSEQRRIAAILDNAEALRSKRREAIAKLDQLLQSVFLEMFGDTVENPKNWPQTQLNNFISSGPQNGLYKPSKDYGSGNPILRIDSFNSGDSINNAPEKRVNLSAQEINKYSLNINDIVINRVNSPEHLGKSSVFCFHGERVVFESNMMRFSLDSKRMNPIFINFYLKQKSIKNQIFTSKKDAVNQSSINQTDVRNFLINTPPIDLQEKFSYTLQKIEIQKKIVTKQNFFLDALTRSLSNKYFT